jgi:hypothetical protein
MQQAFELIIGLLMVMFYFFSAVVVISIFTGSSLFSGLFDLPWEFWLLYLVTGIGYAIGKNIDDKL